MVLKPRQPCCHLVQRTPRSLSGLCTRSAWVVRDGKAYCRTHDPELADERRKYKEEQAKRERERWQAYLATKKQRRALEIAAGLTDLSIEEIIEIRTLGGIRKMLRKLKPPQ